MNSIRNGLGMGKTEIAKDPSRAWNPHFYAVFAQVHNTLKAALVLVALAGLGLALVVHHQERDARRSEGVEVPVVEADDIAGRLGIALQGDAERVYDEHPDVLAGADVEALL